MKEGTKYRALTNTVFLYLRMFVTIVIGLYTSRVVLRVLGESDYGIFSLVGGIVLMLGFLNAGMLQASQRFLSFALGKKDQPELERTFWASWYAHLILATTILIAGEVLGIYLVSHVLSIPAERLYAAHWVLQCALLTSVVSMISVPYNSAIIAHERMKSFAYISILEATMKLGIVYALLVTDIDRLIVYAVLMVAVQILIRVIYVIYCRQHFAECRSQRIFDPGITKEIATFAGWSILGNWGIVSRDQGANMLLNIIFATPVINAARGIATQVNSIVSGFATNITLALNPSITKEYAAGNRRESCQLVQMGCRLSYYMMLLLIVPLLVNIDYVLALWLGNVPENTSLFLAFILIGSLIYAMSQPVTIAIQATGKIKNFQIGIFGLMVVELLAMGIVLYTTHSLFWAMVPSLLIQIAALLVRLVIIQRLDDEYSVSHFLLDIVLRGTVIGGTLYMAASGIRHLIPANGIFSLLLQCLVIVTVGIVLIALLGINPTERKKILNQRR